MSLKKMSISTRHRCSVRVGVDYIQWMQFWLTLMSNLAIYYLRWLSWRFGYEWFWPPYSLNLNPVRLIFKGVHGKSMCTETAPHSWRTERRNFICCHLNRCRHSKQRNFQFSVWTAYSLGCRWFVCWTCFPLAD
jgi:hypothetical protein